MVKGLVIGSIGFCFALAATAQPRRIVSTFPSITETLFALGAGDRVVGVSNYCRHPPAALALPKVGTYAKPDPEKIALLRPDLVIVQKSAAGLADRLSALNIPHAAVTIGSLADIYAMIDEIGRATGLTRPAQELDARIRSHLESVRAETAGRSHPKVLIVVGRTPGLLTNLVAVGPSAYLGELATIAGGSNVLTESAIAYPRISLETVVRMNPAVILDLSMMGRAGGDSDRQNALLRQPWLAHPELDAVRNGKVFGLTSETLVTPGPRVIDAVDLIRAKIHDPDPRP
jgi:iron complex transport system substrate-binding protein